LYGRDNFLGNRSLRILLDTGTFRYGKNSQTCARTHREHARKIFKWSGEIAVYFGKWATNLFPF
jgi:hypothetical protein